MELPQDLYRFGDVELDISNLRVTVSGEVRPLEPKSFRLLQFLIENRHRVVPKDEILTVVWDGVAVSDNALTRAIAQVRKALDDDPKQPRYIETVPTVGYRFAGELLADTTPTAPAAGKKRTQFRPLVWAGLAAVLALAAVPLLRRAAPQVPPEPVPFTTYPGSEREPSFSPDGNQIAFSWTGEHDDNADIYVKTVGSETPLRLTTDPAEDRNPKWSPDGRWIAFERLSAGGRVSIMLIPPLGGPERKLTELLSHWNQGGTPVGPDGISFSPDGKWLAVSGDIGNRGTDRISLVSVETGEDRECTRPPPNGWGDYFPAFSPDGAALVFERQRIQLASRLYRVRLDRHYAPDGEPKELPVGDLYPVTSDWTAGGREILFSTASNGVFGPLYRMPADGAGPPTKMDAEGGVGTFALSRARGRLAYSVGARNTNIWRLDLAASGAAPGNKNAAPERLIASTRREVFPQYSPDGRRIAFYSNRSGSTEVWVCDADGMRAAAITSVKRGTTGTPRWSPDGRTISFDSSSSGTYQVYTVNADGGRVRQMTTGNGSNFGSNWARDGRWIYFTSNGEGSPQVWKMPSQGGAAVQVTHNGGMAATESQDGRTLFYIRTAGNGSLWKMPVAGGPEEKVVDTIYRFNYALTGKGVYLTRDGSIDFVDFATGAIRTILKTPRPDLGLAISPDGRYLLFAQVDAVGSDLMLVENFR